MPSVPSPLTDIRLAQDLCTPVSTAVSCERNTREPPLYATAECALRIAAVRLVASPAPAAQSASAPLAGSGAVL